MELALQSPGVALAESQLELARERLDVADSFVTAELSGGYSATWGEVTAPSLSEPRSLGESDFDPIALSATLNVVPYGPRHDQIQRERWGVLRARSALQEARAEALATVSRQYLEALRAGEEARLRGLELQATQARLEATRAQAEAGAANEAQVLGAQIAVSEAENALAEAERARQGALAALSLTLGVEVSEVTNAPALAETLRFDVAADARLDARDDVLNALLAVREAELTAAATTRENLPSGSLSLGYRYAGDSSTLGLGAGFDTRSFQPNLSASLDPDSGFSPELSGESASSVSLSLGLTVPLEPALGSALDAARLSVRQAEAQAKRTRELARLDIRNSRAALGAAERVLELAERLARQSRQAAENAAERYELGLLSPIELQETRIAAAEAELGFHRAQDALLLARLALARALALNPLEVF